MAERSEVMEEQAVRDASSSYSVGAGEAGAEDVPPGYKRTKVGVIPDDWELVSIGDVLSFKNGLNKAKRYFGYGTPIVNYMDVYSSSSLHMSAVKGLVSLSNSELKAFDVRRGDVFFTRTSETPEEIGVSAVMLDEPESTVFSGFVLRGRPATDRLDDHFKKYCFSSSTVRSQVIAKATYTTRALTNGRSLSAVLFPVPPIQEQRAIATALSDADALIESLDRLIAKKSAIKQAAMQQLLTGQTRLPGFTGEWEAKWLGEIGTFYKGQGIRRDDVSDEGVPCIRYGEIYTRYSDCVIAPESRISESVSESAFPLRSGDILFAGSGETAEEIGMCVAYLGEQPAFAGGDIVVLRPNGSISAYLGRLLNDPIIAQQKARLGQGDAVVHISARNLAQIEVHLPNPEEQTAIATVLSDMDTEIETLEYRRDKARQIKQGMMQQLLTGRVRLVAPHTTEPAAC